MNTPEQHDEWFCVPDTSSRGTVDVIGLMDDPAGPRR